MDYRIIGTNLVIRKLRTIGITLYESIDQNWVLADMDVGGTIEITFRKVSYENHFDNKYRFSSIDFGSSIILKRIHFCRNWKNIVIAWITLNEKIPYIFNHLYFDYWLRLQ